MHYESLQLMQGFIKKYLDPNNQLKILDVGSTNVSGGTYRGLFVGGYTPDEIYHDQKIDGKDYMPNPNWTYIGGDLQPGENVDILFKEPYDWNLSEQYDVIVSGQTLEHVEDTHRWILEMKKYLKDNGLLCIIVPNKFREHRCPVDCWRVFPDGMNFLLKKIAGFEIINIYMYGDDTVGIARKI